MSASHPACRSEEGHICQKPSGRLCIENGCPEPAGTFWGPYWCPRHDMERLDRITASLEGLLANERGGDAQPVTARDLVGIAPDFTGGLSVDDYMDEQRSRGER